jgi:Adenylate and Guanylate cyclase catalytic domain
MIDTKIFFLFALASRMESSGIKDKIHISQATATLLEASGKSHWLTQREELLDVKGTLLPKNETIVRRIDAMLAQKKKLLTCF